MRNETKITAVKTSDGFYITAAIGRHISGTGLEGLFLNGVFVADYAKDTFHKEWLHVPEEVKTLQRKLPRERLNRRMQLIDKSIESEKIPATIEFGDIVDLDRGCVEWEEEYSHLVSLYKQVWDDGPERFEDVEFSFDVVLSVDKIDDGGPFAYSVERDRKQKLIERHDIQVDLMGQIMFPEIAHPALACKLSSQQTYDIVRQHVKDNLNPVAAEITSDYDFCFTVKKKIRLAEVEKFTVDVNNNIFQKRKRKPKYEERYRRERLVEVFEMTSEERGYQGYTRIKGFTGKNQRDLKEKIDFYLESLMEFLNKPLVDCPDCKGLGVVLDSQTESERRDSK